MTCLEKVPLNVAWFEIFCGQDVEKRGSGQLHTSDILLSVSLQPEEKS
jgi:hypothetical protein